MRHVSFQNGTTGWRGGELLNKVVIFVFFAHKKYSHSFVKLQLNHWCYMAYFNDVLTTFLCLDHGSSLGVYGGSESSWFHQKYLNLCSEDERWRSYGFGTTRGWVINDRFFIFLVNYPFKTNLQSFMICYFPFLVMLKVSDLFLKSTESSFLFSMPIYMCG